MDPLEGGDMVCVPYVKGPRSQVEGDHGDCAKAERRALTGALARASVRASNNVRLGDT